MLFVLGSFLLGILIGIVFRHVHWLEPLSGKLTQGAVIVLLFLLGLGVGLNEEIRNHLDVLGLQGLLIACFAVAGSLLLSWVIWILYYKRNEG